LFIRRATNLEDLCNQIYSLGVEYAINQKLDKPPITFKIENQKVLMALKGGKVVFLLNYTNFEFCGIY